MNKLNTISFAVFLTIVKIRVETNYINQIWSKKQDCKNYSLPKKHVLKSKVLRAEIFSVTISVYDYYNTLFQIKIWLVFC